MDKYIVRVGELYVGEDREESSLGSKPIVLRKGYDLFYHLTEALPFSKEEVEDICTAFKDYGEIALMEYCG